MAHALDIINVAKLQVIHDLEMPFPWWLMAQAILTNAALHIQGVTVPEGHESSVPEVWHGTK